MRLTICFVLGLCLTACATVYKPAEDGVAGYRELQLDKTSYIVQYTEAAKVPWEQIHGFALKRAAELAEKGGYAYFDVVSKKQGTVFLETDVDSITINTMGNIASDPPITNTYKTGGMVEGRRVTYEIILTND